MKKKFKIIAFVAAVVAVFAMAVGCKNKEKTLVSLSLKSGTIVTSYEVGDIPDFSGIKVTAKMSDGSEEELSYHQLTLSAVDTSTPGIKKLKVTYLAKSIEIEITVNKKPDEIVIFSVDKPDFLAEYENNIKVKENKETEYYVRNQGYYVGSGNPFIFKPVVYDTDYDTVESYQSVTTVYIYRDNAFVELKDELGDYVDVDENKQALQFTDKAEGNRFKISMYPQLVTAEQLAEAAKDFTVEFEFTVVSGYNVTGAKDMAVLDNGKRDDAELNKAWAEFKKANNIPTDNVDAIIMHNNISITAADFPDAFLYKEGDADVKKTDSDYEQQAVIDGVSVTVKLVGSLRDFKDIYYRTLNEEEDFKFIGNYFKLDAAKVPYVIRESGQITTLGSCISHATLIRFYGAQTTANTLENEVKFKNINFVGNSNRSENFLKSGGLIFTKAQGVNFNAFNNLSSAWFINYFPQMSKQERSTMVIDRCKAYDSFNSLLYSWGSAEIEVKDSEMIGAGGPVMLLDHVEPTGENGGYPPKAKVTNSTLQSLVAGTEGWFNLTGASILVNGIKGLDEFFRAHGRTFLVKDNDTTLMNLICIVKSGSAQGVSFDPIKGYFAIDDNTPLDFGQGESDASQGLLAYLLGLATTGVPVFQSAAGGVCTCMETGLSQFTGGGQFAPVNSDDPVLSGDYINFYISNKGQANYIGAVFGYYEA